MLMIEHDRGLLGCLGKNKPDENNRFRTVVQRNPERSSTLIHHSVPNKARRLECLFGTTPVRVCSHFRTDLTAGNLLQVRRSEALRHKQTRAVARIFPCTSTDFALGFLVHHISGFQAGQRKAIGARAGNSIFRSQRGNAFGFPSS